MTTRRMLTAATLIAALAAVPAFAQEGRQARSRGDRGGDTGRRAVPRAVARAPEAARPASRPAARPDARPAARATAPPVADRAQRRDPRQYEAPHYAVPRRAAPVYRGGPGTRGPVVVTRGRTPRYVPRYHVAPGYGAYGRGRPVYARRYVYPRVVTVVPYRPYYYRPRFSLNVFYGAGGSYPYGYTPRSYYNPSPGHLYGGVRITNAPREAQVFANGYYVGIVDDFDGIFQHMNLEAGEHYIEIHVPGLAPIAFDILVQPGRTVTLRADIY